MPAHRKPRLLPDVKPCQQCGANHSRPPRVTEKQWAEKRFCSISCASKWKNAQRARPVEDRFWERVNRTPGLGPDGECWEWRLGRTIAGYGRLSVGSGEVKAHRFAYELAHGPIPDGMVVCHRCDHPPCCNPAHLFAGTPTDNMADMVSKGRSLRGERHHKSKLSEDDVRAILADGRMQIEIAAAYGVTQGLIGMIKRREIWKHLD